ncbi:MAG: alpha/beta hydrolase [Promethearchaeota archaeon]
MVSLFAKIMMKQLEKNRDYPFSKEIVNEVRATFEKMTSKIKPAKGITVEEIQIGNISAEKYSGSPKDSNTGVMLYLHGGGYFMGSVSAYRAQVSILCKKLHLDEVYSIDYRLAPENPYPAALDDAFETYTWLLEEKFISPENIIVMGDSAGGGLALALLHRIKSRKLQQPKAVICLSAWTDLTLTSESMKTKVKEDPFFSVGNIETSAEFYLNGESPDNPEVSPIFADFSGFPPIFLQVGSRELLLDDTLTIAEKMKKQGVSVTVDVQEGMFHAFLIFYMIPIFRIMMHELRYAMKNVQRFVDNL